MAEGKSVSGGITDDFLQYCRKYDKQLQSLEFKDTIRRDFVVNTFMFPAVDSCLDPFGWGSIDMKELRRFCESREDLDERRILRIVTPVMKPHKEIQTK